MERGKSEIIKKLVVKALNNYKYNGRTLKIKEIPVMREISFKGKRIDNGKWVEGNIFISDTDGRSYILMGTRTITIEYEVIPETVSQFTGLIDKNNVKIFENDIVKCNMWCVGMPLVEITCRVWYRDGSFAANQYSLDTWLIDNKDENMYMPDVKIIGNAYDNPELLKVSEEQWLM